MSCFIIENLSFLDLYIHLVMILLEYFFVTDYFLASSFGNLHVHQILVFCLLPKMIVKYLDYLTKISTGLNSNFNNDFHRLYSLEFFF